MKKFIYTGTLSLAMTIIVGCLILCVCERNVSPAYRYTLEVRYGLNQRVTLTNARIFYNKKEAAQLFFINGVNYVTIPWPEVQRIRFKGHEDPGRFGKYRKFSMEIFAVGGERVECDSIASFYIRGQSSKYVEKVLANDSDHWQIEEFEILDYQNLKALPKKEKASKRRSTP